MLHCCSSFKREIPDISILVQSIDSGWIPALETCLRLGVSVQRIYKISASVLGLTNVTIVLDEYSVRFELHCCGG